MFYSDSSSIELLSVSLLTSISCFFLLFGDHLDLHVLTHSFPTPRSSDLGKLSPHHRRFTHGGQRGQCADGKPALRRILDAAQIAQAFEDRKSTRLNSSHYCASRMPSSD